MLESNHTVSHRKETPVHQIPAGGESTSEEWSSERMFILKLSARNVVCGKNTSTDTPTSQVLTHKGASSLWRSGTMAPTTCAQLQAGPLLGGHLEMCKGHFWLSQ